MKNKIYFKLIFIGVLLFNSGCLKTRGDVKDVEESKLFQSQLVTMQNANADYVGRVEEALENHRALIGRVEVLEHKLEKTEGSDSEKQTINAKEIVELTERIKLLQTSIAKLDEENQVMQNDIAALKNKSGKIENTSTGTVSDNHSEVFSGAEQLFKEKKWKEAILQYDEYKKKSPKGKAIPEAIYKTGVCFQELSMKNEAKVFYQEVISKFPKSDFARKAQIRLKSI